MIRLPQKNKWLVVLALVVAVPCAYPVYVHGKSGLKKAVTHTVAGNAGKNTATGVLSPVGQQGVQAAALAPALPLPVQGRTSSSRNAPALIPQFDFSTKKDPFKPDPAISAKPVAAPTEKGGAIRDALPIHRFDVSQFRLIGIVMGGKDNRAMVVDPNGKGYVLKPGMTIGKNDGKIVSITATTIEVVEQFRDDNGKLRKETIKIALPRKQ